LHRYELAVQNLAEDKIIFEAERSKLNDLAADALAECARLKEALEDVLTDRFQDRNSAKD